MIELRKDGQGLEIYYAQHKPLCDQLSIELPYDKFEKWAVQNDVYGIYKKDQLIGNLILEPYKNGYMMHIAIDNKMHGRWMFYWSRVKKWLLNQSKDIYTGSHFSDGYLSRLLGRAGFEMVGTYQKDWYRWKLCQQQQRS